METKSIFSQAGPIMDRNMKKSVLGKGFKDISGLHDMIKRKKIAGVQDKEGHTTSSPPELHRDGDPEGHVDLGIPSMSEALNANKWAGLRIQDRIKLGSELIEQRVFKEAIEILGTVATEAPQTKLVWYFLGLAYVGLKMRDQARSCFEIELSNDPSSKESQWALGFLSLLDGDDMEILD